jgi:drug/metabolite transporter (DMT)-like permease
MTALAQPVPAPRLAVELALLLLLATLWGASYGFIAVAVATIPPITLMAVRTLIAGLVLLVVVRGAAGAMPRDGRTWRLLLVQGCLNAVVPFTLIAWGQQAIEAGLAVILNATTPVFAFLITAAITRHEATSARKLAGVACGLAGVCVIVGVEALGGLGRELVSQLAVVAATVSYGWAVILGRRLDHLHPLAAAAGTMLCAAAVLLPLSALVDRPWTLAPSSASLLAVLALAIVSTALAFALYFRLIRTLGSVGASAQAYLRVPIGVAIGVLALGDRLAPTAWIGLVCVVAGVALMTWRGSAPAASRRAA